MGDTPEPEQPDSIRKDGYVLIFRRFRRDPHTGRMLDARQYGRRAWPMWVPPHS